MSESLAKVEKIYQEDPKIRKDDVDLIFQWLEIQPHLPQLTELQVILFLHSCRYEIEATQKTIEKYFTMRSNNSDLFMSADENLIRRTLTSFFIGFMPKRTPNNYAVFLVKLIDSRPEKYVCVEHSKIFIMTFLLYFHQYGPANGLVALYDMEGTSLGHAIRINLSAVKTMTDFVQEAAPVRITGIHYLNTNSLSRHIFKLVKPFMKRELYEMNKFHSHNYDTLYEHVPRECLPKEYGGELATTEELQEANLKNLLDHTDFFKWHDSQKVDESKREQKKGKGFFGFF